MWSPTIRRAATSVAAGGVAVLSLSGCFVANNTAETIAFAGSDTTENVIAAVTAEYNADTTYNPAGDNLVNILSVQSSPLVVAADSQCVVKTYHTPAGPGEIASPNGSSNGRNALKASVQAGDGCIDVARSSGPPRAIGSDLATFEYYAFGMDALGWASASTKAPANMTLTQLRGVYNCTFTDWSQVGGAAGAIERYMPQSGSGTYQFFKDDVLGFDPATFSGPSCPAVQFAQENSGELIATNGDQETALVGYSAGNWVAQARGTAPEQRAGQTMRDLNGQNLVVNPVPGTSAALNTAGPVNESNIKLNNPTPAYPGIRYVFNVIDSTHKNYKEVIRYVGFENKDAADSSIPMASPLCDGSKEATIASYGFGPLDSTVSSRNLLGSRCRLFTP